MRLTAVTIRILCLLALVPAGPVRGDATAMLPESLAVSVAIDSESRVIELRRHSLRAPGFQLLVQGSDGRLEAVPPPPPRTYEGTIAGEPGSRVAASLLPEGLSITVLRADGSSWSMGPHADIDPAAFACGWDPERFPAVAPSVPPSAAPRRKAGGCTLAVADVAFDSDYEYFLNKAGGDEANATAIIEEGLNITNQIYIRDVKIFHRLSAIVLRTDPATDFYRTFPDASDFDAMLVAFRREWNANMGHIDRDVAYLLTGKSNPEYGGLAWVSVVCTNYHYGMGIGGRGYEGIFRHEVGHNWGAGHSCGAERSYIMCGNSIDAISAYNIAIMEAHRDSRTCLDEMPYETDPAPPYVRPDPVFTVQGDGPITIDVLRGDTDINCDALRIGSFDRESSFGAAVRAIDTLSTGGVESLLYAPRSDLAGLDFFTYTASDGAGFEVEGAVLVTIMPRALVGYYPLEETTGDETSDASGYGNDGELRGDLLFDTASEPSGRYGRAIRLSGVDGDYVSVEHDARFDFRYGMTVAAWFTVTALGVDSAELVSKGSSGWALRRNGTARTLEFACNGLMPARVAGTVPIDGAGWHHAAGVYDGTALTLYVDGVVDATVAASGLCATNGSSIHIGGEGWNGLIDEVRVYNFALSSEGIRALANGARIENPEPPDAAIGALPRGTLRWMPSPAATAHEVYLGLDAAAVAAATTASPEFRGRRTDPSFPLSAEAGKRYFWRVDEVVAGAAVRGEVRSFTASFASTDFDEPPLSAGTYHPGPGAKEIGFETRSTSTGGEDPFAGVIETGSTLTTPVFSHRSVDATTTFDAIDLSQRGRVAATLMVQARSTGYEPEDRLEAYVTNGADRVRLLELGGGAPLAQFAGGGYRAVTGSIPAAWDSARLVIESSSNSGQGSERFDFDQVGFSCSKLAPVIASTYFREPTLGAASYTPGAGAVELGFQTQWAATSGGSPLAGVIEVGSGLTSRLLAFRSVNATTTFSAVDLRGRANVWVTAMVRVHDTGYEAEDRLEVYVTDGAERVHLLDVTGTNGLNDLPFDTYTAFRARVPASWERATLVVASSSNSSAGAERFDIATIEFVDETAGDPCAPDTIPEPTFRRGDANASGGRDVADAIFTLSYLFAGKGVTPPCFDSADANDDGTLDISDAIKILAHLFAATGPLKPPFDACGADPSADLLSCARFEPCE